MKKFFYAISMILVLGCIAVLICSMSPSLTESLADVLYGTEESSGEDMGQTDEEVELLLQTQVAVTVPEDTTGAYVAPLKEELELPAGVNGKSGCQPVNGAGMELLEEEAAALKDTLETGNTGAALKFDTDIYPYYGMLSADMQRLYRQIYANALECGQSFAPVVTVTVDNLKQVFEAVYNDHPELYWLETEYSCRYKANRQCMEITLQYNALADTLEEAQQKLEERVQEILKGTEELEDNYAKEKYIHDVLVETVDYSERASMGQSAYSALVNGQSVCAGYARAFQYLLQRLSIPCYYCTGYAGENHAWNIVRLGSEYYNVDVTWDDTKPSTYDYFNQSDEEYAATHMRTGLSVYLPACSGGSRNQDNRQEPITLKNDTFGMTEAEIAEKEKLDKAGLSKAEVMYNMTDYYADCLEQLVEAGTGLKTFTNVIPETLWSTVEQAYGNKAYEAGYVNEALKRLGMKNFAIQIQMDDLGQGYYRLYHNVSTW